MLCVRVWENIRELVGTDVVARIVSLCMCVLETRVGWGGME